MVSGYNKSSDTWPSVDMATGVTQVKIALQINCGNKKMEFDHQWFLLTYKAIVLSNLLIILHSFMHPIHCP